MGVGVTDRTLGKPGPDKHQGVVESHDLPKHAAPDVFRGGFVPQYESFTFKFHIRILFCLLIEQLKKARPLVVPATPLDPMVGG